MKTIKGKVIQIITPDKQENYILPWKRLETHIEGKYLVMIESFDVPKSFLKRFYSFTFGDGFKKYTFPVVMEYCSYNVNDIVELTIDDILVKSGFYTIYG